VASDPSKGLVVETERLALAEPTHNHETETEKGLERPLMERFVTAAEV